MGSLRDPNVGKTPLLSLPLEMETEAQARDAGDNLHPRPARTRRLSPTVARTWILSTAWMSKPCLLPGASRYEPSWWDPEQKTQLSPPESEIGIGDSNRCSWTLLCLWGFVAAAGGNGNGALLCSFAPTPQTGPCQSKCRLFSVFCY